MKCVPLGIGWHAWYCTQSHNYHNKGQLAEETLRHGVLNSDSVLPSDSIHNLLVLTHKIKTIERLCLLTTQSPKTTIYPCKSPLYRPKLKTHPTNCPDIQGNRPGKTQNWTSSHKKESPSIANQPPIHGLSPSQQTRLGRFMGGYKPWLLLRLTWEKKYIQPPKSNSNS